jgi:signal transduction histidine kinase
VGVSRQAMKTVRLRPRLGILFVLAVGLPSAALVVIAVRSISGEEAVLEKRLERTLIGELDHVVALVADAMLDAREELSRAAPRGAGSAGPAALAAWKASSDLVGVPFLLSGEDRLVEPARTRELSGDEQTFLYYNEEFLAGRVETPVFLNVGVAYQQAILDADTTDAATAAGAGSAAATADAGPAAGDAAGPVATPAAKDLAAASAEAEKTEQTTALGAQRSALSGTTASGPPASVSAADATAVPPASAPAPAEKQSSAAAIEERDDARGSAAQEAVQEAVTRFKEDETVQKRVLDLARSEGATPVERLVQPQAKPSAVDDARVAAGPAGTQPSIYVTRQRTFREIRADTEGGLVPRLVQDSLELLFWVRTADGGAVGCLVDLVKLSARLAALLPAPYSGERILALLDERAEPLLAPPDGLDLDWRRPFAALELHEGLPGWEAASYLADPDLFASRVRLTTSLLWILVAILVVSIGGGGAFVFLGLGQELSAAQQRTTFVANVSHDLKTPLTSIRMFAEMLRDGRQADPERRQRYLDLMVAEAGRLTRLVNNVLDFSQLEQGRKRYAMREVDLAALCRGVIEAERPRLEQAGFSVAFEPGAGPARVLGDEDALRQVLANLLSNAEKYSGDRRDIGLETGAEGGRPFFRVLDRGIGIGSEHAQKIFREFYRVDDSLTARVKGTGLGLSIARRIVRDHGGELTHEPREGGGSAFRAVFPAAADGSRRAGRRPRARGRGGR